ncbi:TIGR02300 family protein [Falsochrobactrum shanghaiense]|uniref:TIGR02300 family protein n=1 Tax=Falsochrobactrum shanghaiense TaxID=2201899 RepID=A0A316JFR0_9HYPH|nr:TIGR02300 family protein [Falsochrobactrum shanghaiense]PWL19415.1 TIGR02300 family protein [Falsochrobactrum shanghaiense]
MAKPELGTKRIDPETGKKFYDLNRDPIVSPYTGISYPRSYFEATIAENRAAEEETEEEELDTALEKPEFVSLESADEEAKGGEDIPDIDDDVDLGDDDDDAFLEEEEDENDDVSDILGGGVGDDDEDV